MIWARKVHTKERDNDNLNGRHSEIWTKWNLTSIWGNRTLILISNITPYCVGPEERISIPFKNKVVTGSSCQPDD